MGGVALPAWVGLALTAVVCGGAFWRGEREEQVSAGAFVLCWMATILFRDHSWLGTQWGGLAIDVVFFLILTGVSLRSGKYWPMFAAGFQLLGVVTHIARTVDPGVRAWAYATAGVIWTQLVLVALAVGVVAAWRRSRSAQRAA